MPLSIEDVITPTTAAEIEAEVLSLCATGGLATSSWQPGSVIRTVIAELSEVIARKSLVEVEIARGGLGDLASPDWAKLWAQQIYDVLFIPAAPASGYLKLINATATPHTLQIGALIVAHKTTGKTYRNQSIVNVAANATTPDFGILADELGTAGDAAPGEITKIITPGNLIGVTATNDAAVLGADEEATAALVARTRAKLGSLSPLGPKDAYDFVARTPLDQFPAVNGTLLTPTDTPITRSRTTLNMVNGDVEVYLATAGGAPTPTDVARVQEGFDRWAEPWGTTSVAYEAIEVAVPVTYRVWIRSSLTEAQIESIIADDLARYFAAIPVGGVVIAPDTGAIYQEALTHVIHLAVLGIERVEVTAPAGEFVSINPYEVPVLGTIVPEVTFLR